MSEMKNKWDEINGEDTLQNMNQRNKDLAKSSVQNETGEKKD